MKFNKQIILFVFAVISTTLLYYKTDSVYHTIPSDSIQEFQEDFINMESELDKTLTEEARKFELRGFEKNWVTDKNNGKIFIHAYRNDSLKYWSTNHLPILRFAEIHFPSEGLIHLQNGWYYGKVKQSGNILVCATFLIRNDYSYENRDLKNEFVEPFSIPFKGDIALDQELKGGLKVLNKKGDFVFSVLPDEEQEISQSQSVTLMLLIVSSLILWLAFIYFMFLKDNVIRSLIALPTLFLIRIAFYNWNVLGVFEGTEILDPMLFAVNDWLPSFIDYLVIIIFIVFGYAVAKNLFKILPQNNFKRYFLIAALPISMLSWYLIDFFIIHLIENSTIPLVIEEVFSLNVYSFLAIASVGALFYVFVQLLRSIYVQLKENDWSASHIAIVSFSVFSIFFLIEFFNGEKDIYFSLLPGLLLAILFFRTYFKDNVISMAAGMSVLFLFTIIVASRVDDLNQKKERSERELYANQFATEQSINAEVEYLSTSKKIHDDNFLKRFLASDSKISTSEFQDGLERRAFGDFWERYELEFALFREDSSKILEDTRLDFKVLDNIIKTSGKKSEISSNMYFINDNKDKYSYLIKENIVGKDSTKATLYITLKSKKIPEEIGFPRLLISSSASVTEPLENYSLAKYHNRTLTTKYGEFAFPSSMSVMSDKLKGEKGFFKYDGFEHFYLSRKNQEILLVSKKIPSTANFLTSFSYLFSFYGILLLPLLFRLNLGEGIGRTFGLALRIQVVLISLVFISLLAFGWGSGLFVRTQYNEFTNSVITEKLSSVETEVKSKLGDLDQLSIDENGNYMQNILQKFSKVFYTDINLYSSDGYLLATSRRKVFNKGLLSEQMNPEAYKNLHFGKKSEYVHQEQIGALNYSSAYQPFYNKKGKQLGFINLQHFGQQSEFEGQIEKFLVAIINVFILLLAVSIILAIFISNWLTEPLRILQESFAKVKFGKYNERIHYTKQDEIGALVRDYNLKLDELEFTANQLAQSERESAWREMAKQVAHEIKNPLTPMKLSVQHLLRSFDPNDPGSAAKLNKVANSIIEQIDALTLIANEFSNFAKMPTPTFETINIIPLIKGVIEVFGGSNVDISVDTNANEALANVDKDQFVRVFNNLIKNSIQAIPSNREGKIQISITVNDQISIKIEDNGSGIPANKRAKIFVPYFTTKSTGTGLGLAMVKQIVENHGGEINFETEENIGTTFNIKLPKSK